MAANVEKILKRVDRLESNAANIRSYHQDLADFFLPRKAWQTTIRTKGERLKFNHLYDSTAIRGLKTMASGFHSNLTNPASKWFQLRTRNLDFMAIKEVAAWFKDVERIIEGTLNSSNFDSEIQEFYIDAGCFGTGAVLTLEDFKEKVRFKTVSPSQIVFEEDSTGRVVRVGRTFIYTAQQTYDLFGNASGPAVLDVIKERPEKEITIVHWVAPRDVRDDTKEDNLNMPFESVWIEKSKKHRIQEGGFLENPYAVGRFFKFADDAWGGSPCMDTLADVKLVNAMQLTFIRASMKVADPAVIIPNQGFVLPLNFNPSAVNYRDSTTNEKSLTQVPVSGNLPITMEHIKAVQENIKDGLMVNLFTAISDQNKQMTIPEIQRRISENMGLLGPVVGRFTDEVLDKIISRVFNILYRNGDFPEVPEAIQDQEMDIVYISPLARAQRESEVIALETFLSDVNGIAQIKPEVLDIVNGDKVIKKIAEIKRIDPDLLNDDVTVADIRDARAEQAQQERQLQLASMGADVYKKGAEGDKVAGETNDSAN